MLRTSTELVRYDVEAIDGSIGSVDDLLFDDRTWQVRSLVVDTGGILCHHKVLIDPDAVRELRFPEETVVLSLSKQEVEQAPGIGASPPVSQQHVGAAHDPHLRSCNETSAYSVAASDAQMGDLYGFIIETSTWIIRYVIVDTGDWLSGRLVLLGPSAIQSIDWSSQTMQANVTADAIRHSPPYDGTGQLSRDYEAFLHDYYGWPPYWH
jgi:hypothetical protein